MKSFYTPKFIFKGEKFIKIMFKSEFGSAEQRPPHSGFFNDTKIERK